LMRKSSDTRAASKSTPRAISRAHMTRAPTEARRAHKEGVAFRRIWRNLAPCFRRTAWAWFELGKGFASLMAAVVRRFIIAAAALLFATGGAFAHPHVFVTARGEFVYGNGVLKEIRYAWTFDEMFSAFAAQGLMRTATASSRARNCRRSPRKTSIRSRSLAISPWRRAARR